MNNINFSLAFNIKSKLDKKGEALIYIRANQNGKKTFFTTGISIKFEYWNNKKCEIKNTHKQYISLNREIIEQKEKLTDLAQKIYDKHKTISLELLKEYVRNTNKMNNSFLDFYENELKQSNQALATITNQRTTLNELKAFRKNILFDELNYELLADFEKRLINKGLHHNTIHKYFRQIRKYVNLAIKKDYIDFNKNPFIKFKISQKETHREYLSSEDFKKIINFTLPTEKEFLQPVFDMFLFSLYTGLRFSDVANLPKEAKKHSLKNGNYIELQMIKTKNSVFIPIDTIFDGLNIDVPEANKPMNILNRNNKEECNYLFKPLTNQYVNRQLKEIAKLVEIETKLTFHSSRHTIAMYLINDCGIDIFAVGKLLGHKKIETTQIYAKMSNEGLQNSLKLAFSKNRAKESIIKNAM